MLSLPTKPTRSPWLFVLPFAAIALAASVYLANFSHNQFDVGSEAYKQKKFAQAEEAWRTALTAQRSSNSHPIEHIAVANHLAVLMSERNRFAEAEELFAEVLELRLRNSQNNADIAITMNNLGSCCKAQAKYDDAQKWLELALKRMRKEHPELLIAPLKNLGEVLEHEKKYDAAEKAYKEAFAISKKLYGNTSLRAADLSNCLGFLYTKEGKLDQAKILLDDSLAIRSKLLGESDVSVAISLDSVATLLQKQGNYSDAEPLLKRALTIMEATYGVNHPETARIMNNIAVVYHLEGRHEEAVRLAKNSFDVTKGVFGISHPNTKIAHKNLTKFANNTVK